MNREEALALVKENVSNKNLIKHMLAVEAIMKEIAEVKKQDVEKWALAGLLHDIDFEKCSSDYKDHGIISKEILKDKISDDVLRTIQAHAFDITGVIPETDMEKAIVAADAVSGLVIAAALVIPSKKLADVKVKSIARRFKEKDFARNCSRERMLYCEKIGINKEDFFELSLKALQKIADDLEL
ncbi:MAG: HDIG domain-containing protein [Candidatus Aenigmarchaeota archaeon]|nr:HDIG domain-containing protein [Candidatus Aenigmarchaeota archaeon]